MVVVCFSLFSRISLAVRCSMPALGAMPRSPTPPRVTSPLSRWGGSGGCGDAPFRAAPSRRGGVGGGDPRPARCPPGKVWGRRAGSAPLRSSPCDLCWPRRRRGRPSAAEPGNLLPTCGPPGVRAAPAQLRVRRPRPQAGGMRCREGGGGGGLVSVRAPSCINIWLYPAVRCELGARPAGYKYAQASCSPLGALRRGGREGTGGSGQGRTGRSARIEASERNEIGKRRKELF